MKNVSMLILLAVSSVGMIFSESTEERLAALARNEAAVRQDLASRPTAPNEGGTKEAIAFNCPAPLLVASRDMRGVRALCDVNGDGSADVMTLFYSLPSEVGSYASAIGISQSGMAVYVATDYGSILRMEDRDHDGVGDNIMESPGLAYTERLLPLFELPESGVGLYAENASAGRFNLYRLTPSQTFVQSQGVPQAARFIGGSVSTRDAVYTIDPSFDVVRRIGFNGVGYLDNTNSTNDIVYRGYRVTSIAVDEAASLLFVLEAGSCSDVQPPPPVNPSVMMNAACKATTLQVFRLSGRGATLVTGMSGSMFDVGYSLTAYPMSAKNGKLYLAAREMSEGRSRHKIMEIRYDSNGRLQSPRTFADTDMLGEWPFVGALAIFTGTSSVNVAVPANPVSNP